LPEFVGISSNHCRLVLAPPTRGDYPAKNLDGVVPDNQLTARDTRGGTEVWHLEFAGDQPRLKSWALLSGNHDVAINRLSRP
jgi:hypothetical protein